MPQRDRKRGKRGRRTLIVAAAGAAAVLTIGVGAFFTVGRDAGGVEPQRVAAVAPGGVRAPVARRETRPTLDPSGFTGKAALAYQVAREIPEVLDQLRCYCACTSEYGHVSLLSCYVDGHGST